MTEEEYYEALEAEHKALEAIPPVGGHRACALDSECDSCGKKKSVLFSHTAATLGYPGHPGVEYTEFRICENCLLKPYRRG